MTKVTVRSTPVGWLPFAALVFGAACWGGTWVAARGVHQDVPPATLAFLRWASATVFLLPFCARGLWRQRHQVRAEFRRLAIFAFLGVAAFTVIIFYGLTFTTAINGALINAATPIYVILFGLAGLGERSGWRNVAGAAVAFAGLVVIVTRGAPEDLMQFRINPGDLMILGALMLWALYNIFLREWPTKLTPFIFLTAIGLIGMVMMAPAVVIEFATGATLNVTPVAITGVVYLGTFASIGAYGFWNYGVRKVGAAPATLFQYLIPVFAAIFAILLLDEALYLYHVVGGALIVAGIAVANVRTRRRAPVT